MNYKKLRIVEFIEDYNKVVGYEMFKITISRILDIVNDKFSVAMTIVQDGIDVVHMEEFITCFELNTTPGFIVERLINSTLEKMEEQVWIELYNHLTVNGMLSLNDLIFSSTNNKIVEVTANCEDFLNEIFELIYSNLPRKCSP